MAKETAYTPLNSGEFVQGLSEIQLKQIPPYPDDGVQYAKFSKTAIGLNEYKINYQKIVSGSAHIASVSTPVYVFFLENKTFFMTDIVMSAYATIAVDLATPFELEIGTYDGATFTTLYKVPFLARPVADKGQSEKNLHLITPIVIGPGSFLAVREVFATSDLRVTISGWLE
jgi:hypothetical protein